MKASKMASSLLPYVGLEEVKGDTVGCAKSILAEFIGTMFLVRSVYTTCLMP